jgi:crossover junction endodeoxyribonuclease RusA
MTGADAVTLDLPFPPSTNRLWRHCRGRVVLNPEYRAWIKKTDDFLIYQKVKPAKVKVSGPFVAEIVLDENERKRGGDCDNRVKAVLDYAQRVEIINNDRLAKKVSVEWGCAPHGCRLTIRPQE